MGGGGGRRDGGTSGTSGGGLGGGGGGRRDIDTSGGQRDIETSALTELAQIIAENKELLTTDLVELELQYRGEYGYQYTVLMEDSDGGQVNWTFKNGADRLLTPPVVGQRWNVYLFQRNDWTVLWSQRSYQPEALEAQAHIRQAREDATWLDSMTALDLDALIEMPELLDRNVTTLREARDYFVERRRDLLTAKQRVINSAWSDDGSAAYADSIQIQIDQFDVCIKDIETVDAANVRLAQAAIQVYEALAQIYLDKIEEWAKLAQDALSVIKNPTDWAFWAKKLADSIHAHMKKHAEDFQKKLEELGEAIEDERLLSYAGNMRMTDWPSPTGEALTG